MLSERPATQENTSPQFATSNINSDLVSVDSTENIVYSKEYEETNSLGVR
jgi:hypothetical protein